MVKTQRDNLTFQYFIRCFLMHMGRVRILEYSYFRDRFDWIIALIEKKNIEINPVLSCLTYETANHGAGSCFKRIYYNNTYNILKSSVKFSKKVFMMISKEFNGQLDYDCLKDLGCLSNLTDNEVKDFVLKTGDMDFYKVFTKRTAKYTKSDLEQIINSRIKSKHKIMAQDSWCFSSLMQNLRNTIKDDSSITQYLSLYPLIKSMKGYTINIRIDLVEAMISNTKDKKVVEQLNKLLEKETSKRIWTSYKHSVIENVYQVTSKYDYKQHKTMVSIPAKNEKKLKEFLTHVLSVPELVNNWSGEIDKITREAIKDKTLRLEEKNKLNNS